MKTQDGAHRGYSQTAADGKTVTPPTPQGTGFSFGQATPVPPSGTKGTGKRRWVGGCAERRFNYLLSLFLFIIFIAHVILSDEIATKGPLLP